MRSLTCLANLYRPLAAQDEIRLLLLHPSTDHTSDVVCSLCKTTLSFCDDDIIDSYTALSYVWGDPASRNDIILEGRRFSVTSNLESALRYLRDEHRTMRLWADAVCIDQSNVEERGQQVKQMGDIYGTSQHTIIYLGELAAQGEQLFQEINYFDLALDEPSLNIHDAQTVSVVRHGLQKQFLSSKWFTRVWVFQELVLSRDPWVQCGKERIRWTALCRFELAISNAENRLCTSDIDANPGRSKLLQLNDTRQRYLDFKRIDEDAREVQQFWSNLLQIIAAQRGLGVTDKRDMIYAHIGVAIGLAGRKPGSAVTRKQSINIDYAVPLAQAYTAFARQCIDNGCSILDMVETVNPLNRRSGLPSWVPDWTTAISQPWPLTIQEETLDTPSNISTTKKSVYQDQAGGTQPTPNPVSNASFDGLLRCSSKLLGTITAIGRVFSLPNGQAKDFQQAWSAYFPPLPQGFSKEELFDYYRQIWHRTGLHDAYFEFIGLYEVMKELEHLNPTLHRQMCSEIHKETSQGKLFDWPVVSSGEITRLSDEVKDSHHPLSILMLMHLTRIGLLQHLNVNQTKRLGNFEGRRFCILSKNDDANFDWEEQVGLVPEFAKVGDTVHLIGQSVDRPVTPFLLRSDENDGDVEVQDGTRHVLVGRCFFRSKQIEHARFMKQVLPGHKIHY